MWTDPELCGLLAGLSPAGVIRLFGRALDGGRQPVKGRVVRVEMRGAPQATSDGILDATPRFGISDPLGNWSVPLVTGKEYRATCQEENLDAIFTAGATDLDARTLAV